VSPLTLSTLPEGAVSATLNGLEWAKRCQCSPDCPKVVSPSRTYAYGHSPKYKAKQEGAALDAKFAAANGQMVRLEPYRKRIEFDDHTNTTSLDYTMAKRRAQVELPKLDALIEAADELLELARLEVKRLDHKKEYLVHRHAHLQALIECTNVLTEQER
jgi:hypothetical protein